LCNTPINHGTIRPSHEGNPNGIYIFIGTKKACFGQASFTENEERKSDERCVDRGLHLLHTITGKFATTSEQRFSVGGGNFYNIVDCTCYTLFEEWRSCKKKKSQLDLYITFLFQLVLELL
jgi:hypothetical protein